MRQRGARAALGVAGALVALILAACASSATDGVSSPDDSEAAAFAVGAVEATDAESADVVTLEVMAWKGNETEPAGLIGLFERFEQQHPGVEVSLTYLRRLDVDVQLPRRLESDRAPDVVMTDLALVQAPGITDRLVQFDESREWFGRIDADLRTLMSDDDGRLFVMPLEVIGMGNFVNLDLLEQAGVARPPATIGELIDACRALDRAGIAPMIFTGAMSGSLVVMANGLAMSATPSADFGDGQAQFGADQGFIDAVSLIDDLIDARCFDPAEQGVIDPWTTALAAFEEQQVAMLPQGAWNIASFDRVDGLRYAFTPIPGPASPGIAFDLFGIGWSVPLDAPNRDLAQTFVDWFARPEQVQVVLDDEAAHTPFDDGSSGTPPHARAFDEARAGGAGYTYPVGTSWPKALEAEIWTSVTARLLDPTMTPATMLDRWDVAVAEERSE